MRTKTSRDTGRAGFALPKRMGTSARFGRAAHGLIGPFPATLLTLPLILLALAAPSAGAASARGHSFAFSFAAPGSGADQLSSPAGVAVSESSGDVYVVDEANNRIERFGPSGEFIAAWGWGVADGTEEDEICTSSCQAGIAGAGKGQLREASGVAVDNSTSASDPSKGDVYVISTARSEHSHLTKFSPQGTVLSSLKQEGDEAKWEGILDGIAVDGSGRLWVYRGDEAEGIIERFSDATQNAYQEPSLEDPLICPKAGFAVDGAGQTLYTDQERENREESCPLEEGESAREVLSAKLRLGKESPESEESLQTLQGALDPQPSSALATEAGSGDVLIDNVASVAAFDSTGALIERLALPGGHPSGTGLAVNAASGNLYVADSASDQIDLFSPEAPGKPKVSALSAQALSPSTAKLAGKVDPDGADTHYFFQYGSLQCSENQSSCTEVPAAPGADLGSGFIDQSVEAQLQGLRPASTYFYRLLATNEHGEAQGSETFASITTPPSAQGALPDGRAFEMVSPVEKDGSGIEPLRNEGGLIQASEDGGAITYIANGPIVSEPQGNRAPYPTQALAERTPSGWSSQQIVTPRTKGEGFIPGEAPEYRYFSRDLSLALVQPDNEALVEPFESPPLAPEASEKTMYLRNSQSESFQPLVTAALDTAQSKFGQKLDFLDASEDLSHVVFSSEVPLLQGSSAGLYEWHQGALSLLSLLPNGSPALEPQLGMQSRNARGALSDDGQRIFFSGESELPHGEEAELVDHLYMRDVATQSTLQIDAAAPGIEEPGEEESEVAFQGANSAGTKVFFTDTARLSGESRLDPSPGSEENPADLYECEVIEGQSGPSCELSDLSVDQNPGESAEVLNLAPAISQDGSYIYFVANGVLAPGATPGHCVRSEQETPAPEATCNLYVSHEGAVSFIATLSNEDSGDWGSSEGPGPRGPSIEPRPDLADLTASSSPSGQYLAFMSDLPLTGFDNHDQSPAAKGARDEEVYLYDASSKQIFCASCDPAGARPHGVYDSERAREGLGLLIDRRRDWASDEGVASPNDSWLAASIPGWVPLGASGAPVALRAPRYLSNEGRLFFNSADALVPAVAQPTREEQIDGQAAQVGIENVYEYEPQGLGSCQGENGCVGLISSGTSEQESAFVEASVGGDDAFFVTSQPLLAQDRDTNFDLYDARVCSEASPCLSSEEPSHTSCEDSEACRPGQTPALAPVTASGTATQTGPGNLLARKPAPVPGKPVTTSKPPTRAQRLSRALASCKRRYRHSPKKRAACERKARKAFGSKKPAHHKKGHK